jgi:hypothetical protein
MEGGELQGQGSGVLVGGRGQKGRGGKVGGGCTGAEGPGWGGVKCVVGAEEGVLNI